jgi:N-acetylmuramic acid 6-phosphate (MurNAc-6-P) etherase
MTLPEKNLRLEERRQQVQDLQDAQQQGLRLLTQISQDQQQLLKAVHRAASDIDRAIQDILKTTQMTAATFQRKAGPRRSRNIRGAHGLIIESHED